MTHTSRELMLVTNSYCILPSILKCLYEKCGRVKDWHCVGTSWFLDLFWFLQYTQYQIEKNPYNAFLLPAESLSTLPAESSHVQSAHCNHDQVRLFRRGQVTHKSQITLSDLGHRDGRRSLETFPSSLIVRLWISLFSEVHWLHTVSHFRQIGKEQGKVEEKEGASIAEYFIL